MGWLLKSKVSVKKIVEPDSMQTFATVESNMASTKVDEESTIAQSSVGLAATRLLSGERSRLKAVSEKSIVGNLLILICVELRCVCETEED